MVLGLRLAKSSSPVEGTPGQGRGVAARARVAFASAAAVCASCGSKTKALGRWAGGKQRRSMPCAPARSAARNGGSSTPQLSTLSHPPSHAQRHCARAPLARCACVLPPHVARDAGAVRVWLLTPRHVVASSTRDASASFIRSSSRSYSRISVSCARAGDCRGFREKRFSKPSREKFPRKTTLGFGRAIVRDGRR